MRRNPSHFRCQIEIATNVANKAYLLRRGWTKAGIKKFLGEPDRKIPLRGRPRGRPECVYEFHRVLDAEATPEFQQFIGRSQRSAKVRCWELAVEVWAKKISRSKSRKFTTRDRAIIRLLFLRKKTQAEVAARYKISQQTVSLTKLKFLNLPAIERLSVPDPRVDWYCPQ